MIVNLTDFIFLDHGKFFFSLESLEPLYHPLWAKHVSIKRNCYKKKEPEKVKRGGSVNRDEGESLEFLLCFSFFKTLEPAFTLCLAKRLDYPWLPLKSPSLHVKSRFSFVGALSILLTHFHSGTH